MCTGFDDGFSEGNDYLGLMEINWQNTTQHYTHLFEMFRVFGGHGEKPYLVVLDSLSLIDIIQEKYEEEFLLKPCPICEYQERLIFKPTKKEFKYQRGWDKKIKRKL